MGASAIEVVDYTDFNAGGEKRARFIDRMGTALTDIGFFAIKNHGISPDRIDAAYRAARAFFALEDRVKQSYEDVAKMAQRGYTSFGKEHAKGANQPDLKEFWQVGRTDVPDSHVVHQKFGANVWPREVPEFRQAMTALYEGLDSLGRTLLVGCAEYIGEDPTWLTDMARDGDTILRVIHYPPVDESAPAEAVRAGAHEDINLITLLIGATEEGLELQRNDGTWMPIRAGHDEILVDSGDMIQNCTNGLYKSTTHRVVRPRSEKRGVPRFSMPCFIHPRADVSLAPSGRAIEKTGGAPRFPSVTAGTYLDMRLKEIGVG
jgi:isopenicillin N synthase-like dioxygenase